MLNKVQPPLGGCVLKQRYQQIQMPTNLSSRL